MPREHQNDRPKSPPEGDERTPGKTIGQVKYAEKGRRNTAKEGGGAYAPHSEAEEAPDRDPAKKKTASGT